MLLVLLCSPELVPNRTIEDTAQRKLTPVYDASTLHVFFLVDIQVQHLVTQCVHHRYVPRTTNSCQDLVFQYTS